MIPLELAWCLGICDGIAAGFLLGTMTAWLICARQMQRQALAVGRRP